MASKEYLKIYNQKPERKLKKREYYHKKKEKIKATSKEYSLKHKSEKKRYDKIYRQRPKVKTKRKENNKKYIKQRLKKDIGYGIQLKIKSAFGKIMKHYSRTGKIMSSKQYGINYKKIIEHLKPFPEDIKNYEIDHIIPKSWFNHNNPLEIKWCWSPENLQWLRKDINMWKSDRFILSLTIHEQRTPYRNVLPFTSD